MIGCWLVQLVAEYPATPSTSQINTTMQVIILYDFDLNFTFL